MAGMVTLYHKIDGAVELRAAYADDALAFPDEWSRDPWPAEDKPKRADDKKKREQPAKAADDVSHETHEPDVKE